jgi:nicotinate-nucleotide pyrophosphorylase
MASFCCRPSILFTAFKKDGDATMQAGEIAFELNAAVHTILQCERLVLNTMQRNEIGYCNFKPIIMYKG